MPSTLQRLKYARELLDAYNELKAGIPDITRKTLVKKQVDALRRLLLGEGVEPIKAMPDATTSIADAVEKAIADTNGEVTTGDGLHWALSKKALNKMVAATNQDGPKPYQRERIIAIQSLVDLAKAAQNPVIRDDDGRDVEMDKVYEYFVPFEIEGNVLTVRLLCKKFKADASPIDKMHSMAMDDTDGSRHQGLPDGMLIGLDLLPWDVTKRGEPDLSLPPSADNSLSIAKTAKDREPWEKTRKEYEAQGMLADQKLVEDSQRLYLVLREAEKDLLGSVPQLQHQHMSTEIKRTTLGAALEYTPHTIQTALKSPKAPKALKDAYKKAQAAFMKASLAVDESMEHANVIKKALSEDKPVPAEVLADYPFLKATLDSISNHQNPRMPTTLQRLKYARQLLDGYNRLKAGVSDVSQKTVLKKQISALRQLILGKAGYGIGSINAFATSNAVEVLEQTLVGLTGNDLEVAGQYMDRIAGILRGTAVNKDQIQAISDLQRKSNPYAYSPPQYPQCKTVRSLQKPRTGRLSTGRASQAECG